MGLFGFGKKKTTEEILEEGRTKFENGDLKGMFLTLHGLANKGEPEACYYIGLYWLNEKGDGRMAKKYLVTAARANVRDAGAIVAKEYGIYESPAQSDKKTTRIETPESSDPIPVSQPKPVPHLNDVESSVKPTEVAGEKEQEATETEACKVQETSPLSDDLLDEGMEAFNAKDYSHAMSLLKQAAELGNAAAQLQVGVMCMTGKGTVRNKEEALKWYLKAAEQGYADAQEKCGDMYHQGGRVVAMDYTEARKEALKWYLKAARQGKVWSQFRAAVMYERGEGTTVNMTEALKWYIKAAEQGDDNAQYNVGIMYYKGEGTDENKAEALKWYLKAAEQGHVNAQFNAGVMYYKGEGTAENKETAKKWFLAAARQEDDMAKEYLEEYF